jgi:hypothetical protein
MAADLSFNLALIGAAIIRRGGSASLQQIFQDLRELNAGWRGPDRGDQSFMANIRKAIEDPCAQSGHYSSRRPTLFARLESGQYGLMHREEEAAPGV